MLRTSRNSNIVLYATYVVTAIVAVCQYMSSMVLGSAAWFYRICCNMLQHVLALQT